MTPTAAWPWCSGSGAARTQMPPEPVCKCPRVSRRTANTCSLLWGTPRSPAPGNTSPDPGGQSGRWETAISSWLDCHKGQGTGFFWAQWFAIFLWLSAVSEGCQGLPWEGAASPGLWLATEWWQEGQGWTGLAQRPETQTGRRRQPGDLCWCCRARTPQTQNGSCEHTHTHTHTHSVDLWRYFTSCFGSNFNISSYWSWVFPSQAILFHTRDKKHQLSSVQRQWNVLSETPPPTFYWLSAAPLWKFEP